MEKCLQSMGSWSGEKSFITPFTKILVVTMVTYLKYPFKGHLPDVFQDSGFREERVMQWEPDAKPT